MLQQLKGEAGMQHVMWEDWQQHPGLVYVGCALHISGFLLTKVHKFHSWFISYKVISAGQEKEWPGNLLQGS